MRKTLEFLQSEGGHYAITKVLLTLCIIALCYYFFTAHEESITISSQRDTIQRLQSAVDSLGGGLQRAAAKSDTIAARLNRSIELAGRADTIIAGLRAAVGESGATISQLVSRQLRINGLVAELASQHERVKRELEGLVASNKLAEEPVGTAGQAEQGAGKGD